MSLRSRPFRLLVDASTLRSGGGPIIAAHELDMIHRALGSEVQLLLVDGPKGLPLPKSVPVEKLPRPVVDPGTGAGFLRWVLRDAPRLVNESRADAYLSFVNWLPFRLEVPSAIYLHNPYVLWLGSGRPADWPVRLPRALASQYALTTARAVVVQTESIALDVANAMAHIHRLAPQASSPKVFKICPTGSWMKDRQPDATLTRELVGLRAPEDCWLFYPSVPWAHKNMDGLAAALKIVAQSGRRIRLILPAGGIDPSQLAGGPNPPVVRTFDGLSLAEMAACYDFADAVIFPSLLETAGLGLVEALARARPLLASDRSFVHELCGSAAIRFDPASPVDIAAKIMEFLDDPDHELRGRERAARWKTENAANASSSWSRIVDLLRQPERFARPAARAAI